MDKQAKTIIQKDTSKPIGEGTKYSGQVSIKIVNNKKTINKFKLRNEGLPALFKGICNLWKGIAYVNSIDNIPFQVDLVNKTISGENISYSSILSTPSIVNNKEVGEDNSGYNYTSCTFIILHSQLVGNISNAYLTLQDKRGTPLARVPWPDINLDPGLSAIIEWRLYAYDSSETGPQEISLNTQTEESE